jgi:predicted nucleotidyltransferase
MNNNLLLYGSFSRGDFTTESDVDLLTIINGYSYKSISKKINISYYNKDKLTDMSISGSLFVFHLNREAKILIDEDNTLAEIIFNKFILKKDYNEDIIFAKTLLNDIYEKYDNINNYSYANSKVSWCLRTFYGGIGANQNLAIFSRERIISQFGKESGKFLEIKILDTYQKKLISKIIRHIDNFFDLKINLLESFRTDLQTFRIEVNKGLLKAQQDEFDGY